MKNNLTSIKLTPIIEKIKNYAIYLVAYVIVSTQSFMMSIKVLISHLKFILNNHIKAKNLVVSFVSK